MSKIISTFSTLDQRDNCSSSLIFNGLQAFRQLGTFGTGRALFDGINVMFKISTIDSTSERRLIVEGTLVQPWVAELRRTWNDAGHLLEGRKLVIDLTNATLIDPEGEAAIFELMQEGAKFNCSGVLTRHVLKQAAHRCHMRLQKVLNRGDSKE